MTTRGDSMKDHSGFPERLTSKELAALIVDALVQGGVVEEHHLERALAITVEELDARKAIGDY